jgi:hypothetical protein
MGYNDGLNRNEGIYLDVLKKNGRMSLTLLQNLTRLDKNDLSWNFLNKKNVILSIFYNKEKVNFSDLQVIENDVIKCEAGSSIGKQILYNTNLAITKGGVYIKFKYKNKIYLVCSVHLPIDPKSEDMGNDNRIKCLEKIMTKLSEISSDVDFLILGGDLNFRNIAPEVCDAQSKCTNDQFNIYVMNNKDKFKIANLEIIEQPNNSVNKLVNTCKFKSEKDSKMDKKEYDDCRLSKNQFNKNCFDEKRKPSTCDRILFGYNSTINVSQPIYESVVISSELDHNAVITMYELS